MSEESLQVVFENFAQADSSTTRKYGGTGLGLTLSKQLAHLLDGDIDVESKLGLGSSFALHLPTGTSGHQSFIFDEKDIPVFQPEPSDSINPEKLSGHVLIAEDNLNNQKLIKRHLEKMGVSVTAVDNGKQALDTALSGNHDLIFMDMQMPIMGGIDAVRKLRQKGFKKPIVALTANALQEDKDKCINAGCDEYATKPIHYDQLYQITRKYMKVNPRANAGDPIYSSILSEEEDYKDLIAAFIVSLDSTRKKLKIACNEEEWEVLSSMVHQLKGLGGGYGFPEITGLSAKIEFQLVGKNYSEVINLLDELYILFDRINLGFSSKKIDNARDAAGT